LINNFGYKNIFTKTSAIYSYNNYNENIFKINTDQTWNKENVIMKSQEIIYAYNFGYSNIFKTIYIFSSCSEDILKNNTV